MYVCMYIVLLYILISLPCRETKKQLYACSTYLHITS